MLSWLNRSQIEFNPEVVARELRDHRHDRPEDEVKILEALLEQARQAGAWEGDEYGHPIIVVPMPPREISQMTGCSMEEAWKGRQFLVERGVIRCHTPGLPIGEPGWEDSGGGYELLPPPGVEWVGGQFQYSRPDDKAVAQELGMPPDALAQARRWYHDLVEEVGPEAAEAELHGVWVQAGQEIERMRAAGMSEEEIDDVVKSQWN